MVKMPWIRPSARVKKPPSLDHVIVAPSGVYAVETKTRRKRKAPPGKKDNEVIFDGNALAFPHCRDLHGRKPLASR